MKKSKGFSFKKWLSDVRIKAEEIQLLPFLEYTEFEDIYQNDIRSKDIFKHVYSLIEDKANGKILAIFSLSERKKYTRLLNYKGYTERPATAEEILDKKHCMPEKKTRTVKDLSTPLFGDLPECRKQRGF